MSIVLYAVLLATAAADGAVRTSVRSYLEDEHITSVEAERGTEPRGRRLKVVDSASCNMVGGSRSGQGYHVLKGWKTVERTPAAAAGCHGACQSSRAPWGHSQCPRASGVPACSPASGPPAAHPPAIPAMPPTGVDIQYKQRRCRVQHPARDRHCNQRTRNRRINLPLQRLARRHLQWVGGDRKSDTPVSRM
jgi:hypothetical protein